LRYETTIILEYKLQNITFVFEKLIYFDNCNTKIVLVNFNSHSVPCEVTIKRIKTDSVKSWSKTEGISLVNYSNLPLSFNGGRWKKSYNLELIFVSNKIAAQAI